MKKSDFLSKAKSIFYAQFYSVTRIKSGKEKGWRIEYANYLNNHTVTTKKQIEIWVTALDIAFNELYGYIPTKEYMGVASEN